MLELDRKNFDAEVLEADGPVLVDFWGPACEPCKALMPHVQELADKYGEQMKFTKLDTTKARRLAISHRILGLPTISIFKDGEKIDELTGDDCTVENVEELIKKHI